MADLLEVYTKEYFIIAIVDIVESSRTCWIMWEVYTKEYFIIAIVDIVESSRTYKRIFYHCYCWIQTMWAGTVFCKSRISKGKFYLIIL